MAHMINGRDGQPKNLGIKAFGAQTVKAGDVILRQRGFHFKAGRNVGIGRDDTLYALAAGKVHFDPRKVVSVIRKKEK